MAMTAPDLVGSSDSSVFSAKCCVVKRRGSVVDVMEKVENKRVSPISQFSWIGLKVALASAPRGGEDGGISKRGSL